MKNEILLSIIIPVFNVKKHLKKCMASLIANDMNNVEIILVDDGSSDGSSDICDQFEEKYPFIITKHISNHGVAYARNVGLDLAKGKWIGWVDSDDIVAYNFINIIKKIITLNLADVYKFGYEVITDKSKLQINKNEFNAKRLSKEAKEKVMAELSASTYGNYLWCRIFKRSLFNGLRFPEGNNCEDAFLMVEILERANKFYFYNDKLYYHFYHQNTITTSNNKLNRALQLKDWLNSNIRLTRKLKEYGYPQAYKLSKAQLLYISYLIVNKVDFEGLPDVGMYKAANDILINYKKYMGVTTSVGLKTKLFIRSSFRPVFDFIMNIKHR